MKHEITIHLVTSSQQSKVSSIVNAISELADDLTITCKVQWPNGGASQEGKVAPGGTSGQTIGNDDPKSDVPQLTYTSDPEAKHKGTMSLPPSALEEFEDLFVNWLDFGPYPNREVLGDGGMGCLEDLALAFLGWAEKTIESAPTERGQSSVEALPEK